MKYLYTGAINSRVSNTKQSKKNIAEKSNNIEKARECSENPAKRAIRKIMLIEKKV